MNDPRRDVVQCIHSEPAPSPLPPQSEPLYLTGVWKVDTTSQADAILGGKEPGFVYRRDGHPNGATLSEALRVLHGTERAIVTAQGMSALAAIAMNLLEPEAGVILGQPVYGRTQTLFAKDLAKWKVRAQSIHACDLTQWENALQQKPRLAIIETITNPRMRVPDIERIASLCHAQGTKLLVDNTFATPLLCRPKDWGADYIMESLSKFVCGHSDAMLGFLGGPELGWKELEATVSTFGLASSPLDCWLTRRGLATLSVRLQQACKNAMQMAEQCVTHPMIAGVDYPGLSQHPDHAIAQRLFGDRFGHMLTLHLRPSGKLSGLELVDRLIRELAPDIPFCPSLGEVQTTLSHPVSTSHRSYSANQLQELGISAYTVRISCGIEDSNDVCERILRGLDALQGV